MRKRTHIVFGGQGFIGQNLCKELSSSGADLVLSVDKNIWELNFPDDLLKKNNFKAYELDIISNYETLCGEVDSLNIDDDVLVWHLAANSDISLGVEDVQVDLQNTFMTTVKILEFCKKFDFKDIAFASSSAVYGDWGDGHSFSENDLTAPISNYGAMKLASEALLSASSNSFMTQVNVFRFPNVIGVPATHGVIVDFVEKLTKDSKVLQVLGDGNQNKPYLHVSDLINAMQLIINSNTSGYNLYNIASETPNVFVRDIAHEVVAAISPDAEIRFGATRGGWLGDVPQVRFNTEKLTKLGWSASLSGYEAVKKTIVDIIEDNR